MFSKSPVFFWANIYVPADFEDYCVNTLKKTALLSVLALYIPVSQA
ncbi:TPA: polyisoprenoid-binding protein, partial [Klebsiella pneumoniae]|nr:polyisoprenoid-binding protein [Klebsiella pneumoniae]HCB1214147.1 polyisoprenoid-binding protein [Klebsiella pneumoniae]